MSGFGYHGGQGTVYLFSSVFIGVELLYHVVLISAVQQSEAVIRIHISSLCRLPSHLGHRGALSRVPSVIQ